MFPSTARRPLQESEQALDWERIASAAMHPLQIAILRELARGEASPHRLAARLDQSLGNVAYHVRRLHSYGLVELARTEPRRGAVERFYVLTDALAHRN
jgi:DNA-binding MarR family transcriptional regulator